jgi:hypothetical protein
MLALTLSSPAIAGEGDREAVEGATPSAEPGLAPSTTLRVVPLPRPADVGVEGGRLCL